jgi:hypothetical protein
MRPSSAVELITTAIFVVLLTSCARTPIEEIARNNIREKASSALEAYRRTIENTELNNRELVSKRLNEQMEGLYSLTWSADSKPIADIYLRDHVTTSGGFWGEQRTVSACVRYTWEDRGAEMMSIECPLAGPQSTHTDEQVQIP